VPCRRWTPDLCGNRPPLTPSQETVPQALVCALTATSYEDAIRNAISIGGDSDTVAAIAGGVAEAMFGVPSDVAVRGWSYLPVDMREVLKALYRQSGVAA